MADEVVRLGVDPRGAEEGFRRYDQAAERSIQKTEQLAQTIGVYERGLKDRLGSGDILRAASDYDKLHQSVEDAHSEAIKMNEAMVQTAETSNQSVQGLGRLNSTLASMARQAAGVHPVMGQLANIVGTFALGTAVTTGVLAGMAAIAFAIRKIGEESRTTKERNQELFEELRALGQDKLGAQAPVAERALVAGLESKLRELVVRQLTARTAGVAETFLLDREIQEVANQLGIARGGLRVAEERYGIESFEGPIPDPLYRRRLEEEARRIALNNSAFKLEDRLRDDYNALYGGGWFEGRRGAESMGAGHQRTLSENVGIFGSRLADRERELDAAARKKAEAERELTKAREQANAALVMSLANVGRAYGGVTDQVLSLVSATLALSRMPGFRDGETASLGDMARGYGTAALTGIGFGVSTGNPFLGGAGGAAAGFAMAGPGGAIIGGVAGIVSGLIEQGDRAAAARVQWERTFKAFNQMFDTLTPLESNLQGATAFFNQLVQATAAKEGVAFGAYLNSPEEARRYAEELQNFEGWDSAQRFGRALEALIPLWEANIEKAEELAAAEEARFAEDLDVRALRAQGSNEEADALELRLRQEREYQAAVEAGYDDATLTQLKYVQGLEAEQLAKEELAETIRDVTSALNSPSGLNLSLYRWMASGMFGGGGGNGNAFGDDVVIDDLPPMPRGRGPRSNLTINIYESSNPRDTARNVMDALRREARLGGPNPLLLETM